MNKKILDEIKEACENNKTHESCGFILKKGRKYMSVECQNVSADQQTNFEIPQDEYMFAYKNYEIISIYHSHILGDEGFSKEDKGISDELDIPIIVYSLKTKNINFYNPSVKKHKKINGFFEKQKTVNV